jgi:division protein CdvB (Snf7/Vps24/ESCRT-III family)
MTGFEIAGVVLGIVPILTLSIEHYKTMLSMREIRQLDRSFKTQRIIFMNTIEALLSTLVSETQLKKLLADPYGEAWKDSHTAIRLEKHLGDAYESFTEIMEDIQVMVLELQKILTSEVSRSPFGQDYGSKVNGCKGSEASPIAQTNQAIHL